MMCYRVIVIIAMLFLFDTQCVRAQYESVWTFGYSAGLDFNTTPPTAIQTSIASPEAAASVCDTGGQLLFYTDGSTVWNRLGNLMPNGTGLAGSGGTVSTSQGALIVPVPASSDKYYIFSLTEDGPDLGRLYYSVVDMNLNNGLGDVVNGQKAILIDSLLTERMSAFVGDRCNVWLITVSRLPFAFKSYEITASGINVTPVISDVGLSNSISGILGPICISPDRKHIGATQASDNGIMYFPATIYNLDATTGIVSQPLVIIYNEIGGAFGICFSPDNSKVYVSTTLNGICQFDLSSNDSATILLSRTQVGVGTRRSHLKLGPDGKIYFASPSTNSNYIGAINYPDNAGLACGFMADAIPLLDGTSINLGLPNVVPVIKRDTMYTASTLKPPCFNATLILNAANDTTGWDYVWNNGTIGPATIGNNQGTYWVSYHEPPCTYHVDTFFVRFESQLPQLQTIAGCYNDSNAKAWVIPAIGDTVTYTYTWRLDTQIVQGPLQSNDGDTLNNIPNGTSYTLEITAPNGCDTVLETATPLPHYQASFTVSDSIICMGDSVIFKNTSQGGFTNYQWDFADGTISSAGNPQYSYPYAGQYRIRLVAQTPYPCYDTVYKTIVVDSVLSGQFSAAPDSICTGQSIIFTPEFDSTTLDLSWQWGDGTDFTSPSETVQHAFDQEGVLPVQLTSHFRACPDVSFTDTVYVDPLPVVNLGPDSGLCLDDAPIFLKNIRPAPTAAYQQLWSTGEHAESIKVVHPGTYSLTVTTEPLGCSTTETITVNKDCYIDIPNAFTPNGDGVNDYFFPRQLLSKSVTKFKMRLFNRWGQIVFETTNTAGRGWDGKFNDKDQPQGVYVYLIDAEIDGHLQEHYQGNVTLLR